MQSHYLITRHVHHLIHRHLMRPYSIKVQFSTPIITHLLRTQVVPITPIINKHRPFRTTNPTCQFPTSRLRPMLMTRTRPLLSRHHIQLTLRRNRIVTNPPPYNRQSALQLPTVLIQLFRHTIQISRHRQRALLARRRLSSRAHAKVPIGRTPRHHVSRIAITKSKSRITSRGQTRHKSRVPPISIQNKRHRLVRVQPSSRRTMVNRHRQVEVIMQPTHRARVQIQRSAYHNLRTHHLFTPVLQVPITKERLTCVPFPYNTMHFQHIRRIKQTFLKSSISGPTNRYFPSDSNVRFSAVNQHYTFNAIYSW